MLIKCKDIAEKQLDNVDKDIEQLTAEGRQPFTVIIRVDGDKASEKYVNTKEKKCAERNIKSAINLLPNNVTQEQLEAAIECANIDKCVTGIMLQLPLPEHLDAKEAINKIDPKKDVDCLTEANLGKLFNGDHTLAPCTPKGIIEILDYLNVDLTAKDVLIINRSMLVGKPLAELMLGKNATPTIAHSKTKNLLDKMFDADIIVTAVGQANFIDRKTLHQINTEAFLQGRHVYIIDVSINFHNGRLCGDVVRDEEFVDNLKNVSVTSVPGGVGLTTVSSLLVNSVICAK